MSRSPYKKSDHTILFINPSLGTKSFTRADVLRSYLSLGTLASGVLNRRFLGQLASRLEGEPFHAIELDDLPSFRAKIVQLSLRADRSVQTYLEPIIEKYTPFMLCVTATSAQLGEAYEAAECAARSAPACLRVIGGAHVSVRPSEVLMRSMYEVAIAIPYPGTELEEDQGVRIVGQGNTAWDWPLRNPEVRVSEGGEFMGEGPTRLSHEKTAGPPPMTLKKGPVPPREVPWLMVSLGTG